MSNSDKRNQYWRTGSPLAGERLLAAARRNNYRIGRCRSGPERKRLRTAIEPKFDFQEMSKRSLGAHWNKVTKEEQDAFVEAFTASIDIDHDA